MPHESFPAMLVRKSQAGQITADIETLSVDQLPPGQVTIRVHYSSLNYKDALALEGHPGVVRAFPHVPGIDAAGVVVESNDSRFATGDEVVVTGGGLGEKIWGGLSQFVRVPAEIVVPCPNSLSLAECMIYGTAGFTAGLCVAEIERHDVAPAAGDVVVTGASGGVGSIAVAILARLGYRVTAVTGKSAAHDLLDRLGAAEIVGREALHEAGDRPLLKARWAAAVDTVGGDVLATILRGTGPYGCVTACGLVGGDHLNLTVYPFILRGVTLAGINSVDTPMPQRRIIWEKLAGAWRPAGLDELKTEIDLDQVAECAARIKAGQAIGRTIVRLPH